MKYHLAQVNVARMKGVSIDDPEMVDFKNHTDRVNALAEASPGFIWRDVYDENTPPKPNALDDTQVLINFSVWENVETLSAFTYTTFHTAIMKRQREWFQKYGTAHYALWWIKAGSIPTEKEAITRLTHLQEHGATKTAFTFKKPFSKPMS